MYKRDTEPHISDLVPSRWSHSIGYKGFFIGVMGSTYLERLKEYL